MSAERRPPKKPVATPSQPWPAETIEMWAIERILPYANNSRTHTAADIALIADSMKQWGVTQPALVDEQGTLIVGHARVQAALKLGFKTFPVVVARGWSDAQKNAYRIADNQLAARAGWDFETLAAEMSDLKLDGFDLDVIGFEPMDLARILAGLGTDGLTDPDDVPPVPTNPVTVPGDIWVLSNHRIGCGDSTDAAMVASVLAGSKPPLMVSDPPYGVDYDPAWRTKAGRGGKRALGKVLNDDRADWREAWALFPGDVAYIWHGGLHAAVVADSLTACGFGLRAQIIWAKPSLVLGRGDYHWQHEPCWYAVREGAVSGWASDRKQTTVWEIANNSATTSGEREQSWGHGTQKPVECMRRPIINSSRPGEIVYDPFLGSGTTIIAAEMTGRICHGLELSPAYTDTIVMRWQAFTGRQAIHAVTGKPFVTEKTNE